MAEDDLCVHVRQLDLRGEAVASRRLRIHLSKKTDARTAEEKLTLRLTDDADPFLFFALVVTESDFQILKRQQNLLVDFGAFPGSIRALADKCETDDKFSLVLRPAGDSASSSESLLSFQETNPFRELCHLSLRVCRGTDAQVKEYLVDCVKNLKSKGRTDAARIEGLRSELEEARADLEAARAQVDSTRRAAADDAGGFGARLAAAVAAEKERAMAAAAEAAEKHERDRRESEDRHTKTIRQLENRVAALDYENKDLSERKHKNEASLQRQAEAAKALQEDSARQREEARAWRARAERAEAEVAAAEREASRAAQEAAAARTEAAAQRDLAASRAEQKDRLMSDLEEKQALVAKRENGIRNVSAELVKANDIIRKFMEANKELHQKAKLNAKIAEEQDKVIVSKDKELDTVREELRRASESTAEAGRKEAEASDALRRSETERADLEKKLATNQKVIDWLNTQLTHAKRRDPGLRLTAPPEGLSTLRSATTVGGAAQTPGAPGASSTPFSIVGGGRSEDPSFKGGDKENNPSGLDERYLSPADSANRGLRGQNGSALPSNLRGRAKPARGGLLRKAPPASTSTGAAANSRTRTPEPESVYFPRT